MIAMKSEMCKYKVAKVELEAAPEEASLCVQWWMMFQPVEAVLSQPAAHCDELHYYTHQGMTSYS